MEFQKYHGTGNDFIIIDDSKSQFPEKDFHYINFLCKRRFGIGADGLILIRPHRELDFEMLYFNADGKPGSLCGNGGRCASAFAAKHGWFEKNAIFEAFDGKHHTTVDGNLVSLSMHPVKEILKENENTFILNTGSPHYVKFVDEDPGNVFVEKARKIRNHSRFIKEGINVNFAIAEETGHIYLRTFERGVEDETYSCGTGVVATAIAYSEWKGQEYVPDELKFTTLGGQLYVSYDKKRGTNSYENILLKGPAEYVYTGKLPEKKQ